MQKRNWCFTINNYTNDDIKSLEELDCKYIVYGYEKGANETPHIQGYVEFNRGVRLETLKKLMPRAHLEDRKGSANQAIVYCKKDGNFIERGIPSSQGARNDLIKVADTLKNHGIPKVIEETPHMYIKYHRGLEKLDFYYQKDRNTAPTVEWLWGPTGTGKTRKAVEAFDSFYIKPKGKWWDGYAHQKCIIIDDFDNEWPYRDFLNFLDRYPYQGQTKSGFVKINSPYIFITCEFPPIHYWGGTQLEQVLRRVTVVTEVKGNTIALTSRSDNVAVGSLADFRDVPLI